jgi:hypothetical protein
MARRNCVVWRLIWPGREIGHMPKAFGNIKSQGTAITCYGSMLMPPIKDHGMKSGHV